MDEPTELPEDKTVELDSIDDVLANGDDMDDEERAALERDLAASFEAEAAGQLIRSFGQGHHSRHRKGRGARGRAASDRRPHKCRKDARHGPRIVAALALATTVTERQRGGRRAARAAGARRRGDRRAVLLALAGAGGRVAGVRQRGEPTGRAAAAATALGSSPPRRSPASFTADG